jgi:hypothetical protein
MIERDLPHRRIFQFCCRVSANFDISTQWIATIVVFRGIGTIQSPKYTPCSVNWPYRTRDWAWFASTNLFSTVDCTTFSETFSSFTQANCNNRGLPWYNHDMHLKVLHLTCKSAIHKPWLSVICLIDELFNFCTNFSEFQDQHFNHVNCNNRGLP